MIHAKSFAAVVGADQVHLRILETTDLHVHVLPFDYVRNRPTPVFGLARAAGLIDGLRASAPNVLLFDNGDFLQGSPLGDFVALSEGPRAGDRHPMIAAMNRLGYDAATIGNHEFNHGIEFLRNALAGAEFPVVAANTVLDVPGRAGTALLPPWVLLDRQVRDGAGRSHGLRIGVIGLLPPQTAVWDRDLLQGRLVFGDMVETARALVPALRQAGADLVVALAHTGIGEDAPHPGMENAAIPLAAVAGLDVLLLGHSHQVFPSAGFAGRAGVDAARGTILGKPAVMAGCYGSHVGVIDLILGRKDNGWAVTAAQARAPAVAGLRPNGQFVARTKSRPEILQAAAEAHAATRRYMARPVGATGVPLSTHLALAGDCTAVRVTAVAKAGFVRRALADGPWGHLPVLGAASPFKAGGRGGPLNYTDIPAGALALRHMADLYLYPNEMRAVHMTGAAISAWLERSASIYRQVVPGKADQPLIDPDFPSYNFIIFSGLSYAIDASRPARHDARGALADAGARRVTGLSRNGVPVAAEDEFIVALSNYRVSVLQALNPAAALRLVPLPDRKGREVVADWFLAGNRPEKLDRSEGWRLCLPRGASVILETSPRLRAARESLAGFALADLGLTPSGFRKLRLTPAGSPRP